MKKNRLKPGAVESGDSFCAGSQEEGLYYILGDLNGDLMYVPIPSELFLVPRS